MKPKPTKTKTESRLREAKRQRSEQRERLGTKLARTVGWPSLFIWIGFYAAALVIMLSGGQSMPYRLQETVDRDVTARVDFEMEDRVQTEQNREAARTQVPNVYLANPVPLETMRSEMTELLELAKSAGKTPEQFDQQSAAKGWLIDNHAREALVEFAADDKKREQYNHLIAALTDRLSVEYIVKTEEDPNRKTVPYTSVLRRPEQADREVPTSELHDVTNRPDLTKIAKQVVEDPRVGCPPPLQAPFIRLILRVCQGPSPEAPKYNALWTYSTTATRQAIEERLTRVPMAIDRWKAGETLVKAGTELTSAELEILKAEHKTFLEVQKANPNLHLRKRLSQAGMGVLLLLVTCGFAAYTVSYQERIFRKPARAMGLVGLTLILMGLSRLGLPGECLLGAIVLSTLLLTIAYNQRFALGTGAAHAILVTLISRDYELYLTIMVALGLTVFRLREVRTRSKIIGVGTIAGLGACLASLATGLIEDQGFSFVIWHALGAAAAAILAGFLGQGILPFFERFFGIATSMTLLEWCDAGKPLLRRLNQEAPGTYSHSLLLSQMAEEAAEAIGARGLLARVGALYHDIGKIQKSAYFVENQEARINRHDRLAPTMSLLVIVGHVKDGIEMARAYGLPRVLHQFIAEHHGTTIVKYFHHAAAEAAARNKAAGRHDREIPESEFRYPGPRPRSKETAILMISDSCEGAVRAIDEPTPGRIESTVHQVVMERLNDGQFDDCDITLRELHLVEQSLVKSLCAIHHGRIKYPKANGKSKTRSEDEETGGVPRGEAPAVPDSEEVVHKA